MASQYPSREAEAGQKTYNVQKFVPVNLGMLRLTGQSVSDTRETYCIVCRVERFDESGAYIDLVLRDETGTLNGRIYKSQSKSTVHAVQDYQHRVNGYASILGTLRPNSNENTLVVNRIKNVESCKEVNFHRAQVIWALLVKNSVLKVPQVKPTSQIKMEIDDAVNAEGLTGDQLKVKKVVIELCKKTGKARKEDVIRGVKLMPSKIEEILIDLVNNGVLLEENDYQIFKAM